MAYNLLYYNTEAKAGQMESVSSSVYRFSGCSRTYREGNPLEYVNKGTYLIEYVPNTPSGWSENDCNYSYIDDAWELEGHYNWYENSTNVIPEDGKYFGFSGANGEFFVSFYSLGESGTTQGVISKDGLTGITLEYEKIYKDGTNEAFYRLLKATNYYSDSSHNEEYCYPDMTGDGLFSSVADLAAWVNDSPAWLYKVNLIPDTSSRATKVTSVDPGVGYIAESGRVLYNNDPNAVNITVQIEGQKGDAFPLAQKVFASSYAKYEDLRDLIANCNGNTGTVYVDVLDKNGDRFETYTVYLDNVDNFSALTRSQIETILTKCDSPAISKTANDCTVIWDKDTQTFNKKYKNRTIIIYQQYSGPK